MNGRIGTVMDILPTYLDILYDTPIDDYDLHGQSLLPLFSEEDREIHDHLHWETKLMWAAMRGDWKLVGRFWEETPELYNIRDDIGETRDLASQYPGKVRELTSLHAAWQREHYPNPYPRQTDRRPSYHFPQQ